MSPRDNPEAPSRIAVIGANGWIGRSVLEMLAASLHQVVAVSRRRPPALPPDASWTPLEERADVAALTTALQGVDAAINVAGAAHLPAGAAAAGAIFANEELPRRVGESAVAAGVAQVVHLSSTKAVGEGGNEPLRPTDPPRPTTDYGRGKLAGEHAMSEAVALPADSTLTIVRPPMVYGPQAPANFARLASLVTSNRPVPLPMPYPYRSLVYVRNLASLLVHLATSRGAAAVVHVSDLPHLTTRELVAHIASAAGSKDRVLPVPVALAAPIARLLRRGDDIARLVQHLIVEPSPVDALAGWTPPHPGHEGFRETFKAEMAGGL